MKILAIDTSTNVASTAVLTEKKLIYENIVDDKLNHSQNLLPTLDLMLEKIGLDYYDFDYYAVTIGPGSFTGLRIGISTVKGLSQVTGIKVIPATTLNALSYNLFYTDGLIVPILDARQNRFYTTVFNSNGRGEFDKLLDDLDIYSDQLLESLKDIKNKYNKDVYLLGDGAEKFIEQSNPDFDYLLVAPFESANKASSLAYYASRHISEAIDFHELMPMYLRASYAEK